jgi:hypothetical protein
MFMVGWVEWSGVEWSGVLVHYGWLSESAYVVMLLSPVWAYDHILIILPWLGEGTYMYRDVKTAAPSVKVDCDFYFRKTRP